MCVNLLTFTCRLSLVVSLCFARMPNCLPVVSYVRCVFILRSESRPLPFLKYQPRNASTEGLHISQIASMWECTIAILELSISAEICDAVLF